MQRFLIALTVMVIVPAIVYAKPKVAVAPTVGDKDDVAEAIEEVLSDGAKITSHKDTKKAMDKLDLDGELSSADAKKLAGKLNVDAVVQGKIEKKGKKKTLILTTFHKGKSSEQSIVFKSAESVKKNKDDVMAAISAVGDSEEEDKTAEREKKDREKKEREEREARENDKDKDKDKDKDREERRKDKDKEVAEGDGDGDGEKKIRKRKKDGEEDGDTKGRVLGPAVTVAGGGALGIRRLSFTSSSTQPPPTTGTFAGAAHVEAELYPMAFGKKTGGAAGLGFYGDFERAVGLSIAIPKSMTTVPITQQHYSIGARYRFALSAGAGGIGIGYASRSYVANRTGLNNPTELDTPDVDYKSVSPGFCFSYPVAPGKANFIGDLRGLLLLSSGPIANSMNYGKATAYGAEARAGVDVIISESILLRIAADYSQVSFSFAGQNMSPSQRGVSAATDRTINLTATLAVTSF